MEPKIHQIVTKLQRLYKSLKINEVALERAYVYGIEQVPMIEQCIADQKALINELLATNVDVALGKFIYDLAVAWRVDERDIIVTPKLKTTPQECVDIYDFYGFYDYHKSMDLIFTNNQNPEQNLTLTCPIDPKKKMLDNRPLEKHIKLHIDDFGSTQDVLNIQPEFDRKGKIVFTTAIENFMLSPIIDRNDEPQHIRMARQALFNSAVDFQDRPASQNQWSWLEYYE